MTDVTPHSDTTTFMHALFGSVEPDARLVTPLWTLQGLQSTWLDASNADKLAEYATRLAEADKDVYVSVSASAHLPAEHRRSATRISAENSAGIVGLWADIDVDTPDIHKKNNLPATEAEARIIVDRMGLKPTLLVHSGHGLQAWWLFHEFEVFDSDDDRRRAATLSEAWNRTMEVHAARGPEDGSGRSWQVDMTFDLSRVMRIPGTWNRKADPVMPVRLLEVNDDRYTMDDFADYCLDESVLAAAGLRPVREYQCGPLQLRPDASISVDLLEILKEDDRFADTWDKKRKDFSDSSGSSYDMALATMAANAGVDDQTIADLLIHFRRKHGDKPEKALREDYMRRTIARAKEGKIREDAIEVLDDIAHDLTVAQSSGDPEEVGSARRKATDAISNQLGIEVTRFVRYMSDPPTFRMVTLTQTVEMGGPDDVLRWDKFRTRVWSTLGLSIPRFKVPHWDKITSLIPLAWVEQEVGYEATESGETESWLVTYFTDYPPLETIDEAIEQERPFLSDKDATRGRMVLFGAGFRRHLAIKYGEKISPAEMGRRLTNFGCVSGKEHVTVGKKRTTKTVWVLPEGWNGE